VIAVLMSVMLVSASDGQAQVVSPCDDFRTVPVGTEVVVEGRYFTDFMHGEVLQLGDCLVSVELASRAQEGTLANKFLDATWRRRPFPMLDSGGVTLRMRGVIAITERGHLGLPGGPIILASELLDVSVQGGAAR
jgi:hypothetical protein